MQAFFFLQIKIFSLPNRKKHFANLRRISKQPWYGLSLLEPKTREPFESKNMSK